MQRLDPRVGHADWLAQRITPALIVTLTVSVSRKVASVR
jgi:hypothetical protein